MRILLLQAESKELIAIYQKSRHEMIRDFMLLLF